VADAANDPLRAILDSREPIVATGLDGVADGDALLTDSPRDDANVELALIDSPLLDGVVDRIRLSVRAGYQRHPLAACVPMEVGVDHPLARRVVTFDSVDVTAFGKLASNRERTLGITRIPEPQCEGRVVGIAEPVHRVELDRSVRVADRSTRRPHVRPATPDACHPRTPARYPARSRAPRGRLPSAGRQFRLRQRDDRGSMVAAPALGASNHPGVRRADRSSPAVHELRAERGHTVLERPDIPLER
jgi:hypothetical protein